MTRTRTVRVSTVVLLWLAAAAGATAVGMTAVGMIGSDIFGSSQEPLTAAEIDQQLSTPAPTSSPSASPSASPSDSPTGSPSPSASPPPSVAPEPRPTTINANGAGIVTARCNPDGTVHVLSSVPSQGFAVDADDESDDHPQIKFENDQTEVEVRLRCIDGTIVDEIQEDTDD